MMCTGSNVLDDIKLMTEDPKINGNSKLVLRLILTEFFLVP